MDKIYPQFVLIPKKPLKCGFLFYSQTMFAGKKIFIFLFFIIFLMSVLAIFVIAYWQTVAASGLAEVSFLAIGQGDAELIQTPFGQKILIDGGPDRGIIRALDKVLPWWERKIDLVILTHPHSDHVGGLIDVFHHYKIIKTLYTGVNFSAPEYAVWQEILEAKNIDTVIIDKPQRIKLGENCYLEILFPLGSYLDKKVKNLNNTSIVARFVYGSTTFLFTGDIETETERALLASKQNLRADVLKVAHHGSDTSSSLEFIQAVNPEFAVIEMAKDNDYGFPSARIVKRLIRFGARVWQTGEEGTVNFISNKNKIWRVY